MSGEGKGFFNERVMVALPKGFSEALDELARERLQSRSEFIRQAIRAEFDRAGKPFTPEPEQVAA